MQAVIESTKVKQRASLRLRLHPFILDVMTTGLTQAAALGATFFLMGAVSRQMGLAALGEYLLVKRVSAWLLPATQLGLGVALPRQIAHTVIDVENRARQYFMAGFSVMLLSVAGVGLIAILNTPRVARLCFGSEKRSLLYAMVLLMFGTAAEVMVFGYFRGLERVQTANLITFSTLAVVPVLAFVVTRNSHSAPVLIGATGVGMAVVAMLWAIPKIVVTRYLRPQFVNDVRQLLTYGVARIPGDIANGGLLALGPMVASHYADMAQNSYLLVGIACLYMTGTAISPLSVVLLARISRLLAEGRRQDVNEYICHLRSGVEQFSLLLVVQGLIFARPLVLWWLGPSCSAGVPVIRVLMLAIPAYTYYAGLRSVVDAASVVAYNARNVLIAAGTLVAFSATVVLFLPPQKVVIGVAAATTLAYCVLALATHCTLRALGLAERSPQIGPMWMAGLLGLISLTAQWVFHFQISKPAFGVVMLVNFGVLFLFLRKSQPEWLGFLLRVAFPRT